MKNINKRDILRYTGHMSQIFGVKDYCLNCGKAKGVRAVDIKNGSGLEFTVLPDRGLDIAHLSYKGINFSYISSTGITAPQYFKDSGDGFSRSFYGGFLTTCGINNVGVSCVDLGEVLGAHGRISNTPAEEVYTGIEWIDDLPVMKVRGCIREAGFFAENISISREISVKYSENKIYISDTIENNGFKAEPLMLLYHFNIGYPLLNKDSYVVTSSKSIIPRDKEAEAGIEEYNLCQKPTPGFKEQVFYHDLECDDTGKTFAAFINPVDNLGVLIEFNKNQLGRFTQWKQMGEGEYVLGLEPCNCHVEGRAKARQDGSLNFINPGEIKKFDLIIHILNGNAEIESLSNIRIDGKGKRYDIFTG